MSNEETKLRRHNSIEWPFDSEQASRLQNETAKDLQIPLQFTNSLGMTFRLIPAGSYMMGSSLSAKAIARRTFPNGNDDVRDEAPLHRVRITKPFYIGVREITGNQYLKIETFAGTSRTLRTMLQGELRNDRPVESVTWDKATGFCEQLSRMDGSDYRLPTEAEWEYACRAGTNTPYYFGSELTFEDNRVACNRGRFREPKPTPEPRYDKNGVALMPEFEDDFPSLGRYTGPTMISGTRALEDRQPNAWGLYDMHGNAREWCSDWYGANYYAQSPIDDPTGPKNGEQHVCRGGSWKDMPANCRSSARHEDNLLSEYGMAGFRIVCSVESAKRQLKKQVRPSGATEVPESAPKQSRIKIAEKLGIPVEFENSVGMKLCFVPAGDFMMGSPENEFDRNEANEGPVHRVRITSAYFFSSSEVSQAEFSKLMGNNPSFFRDPRKPVEQVSWEDAVRFCEKLSQREGRKYRLPTEAEWEYACRAGTTTPFHFGSVLSGHKANCDGKYPHPYGSAPKGPFLMQTTECKSYAPNAWGLYDMHGNVYEWCADWFGADYYSSSPSEDPRGPASGTGRIVRGGCWDYDAMNCRSASRASKSPDGKNNSIGFRVLCEIEGDDFPERTRGESENPRSPKERSGSKSSEYDSVREGVDRLHRAAPNPFRSKGNTPW